MTSDASAAHADARGVPDAPCVLVLERDLFFAVKIRETLRKAGYAVHVVRDLGACTSALTTERPAVVMIALGPRTQDWQAGIAAARGAGVPVIAYGAHVDLAAHEAARQAGATRVIANARLAGDLAALVAQTVRATSARLAPKVPEGPRDTADPRP